MKKIVCIGLALVFTMSIILGSNFDLYAYIQNIGDNLPSFNTIFSDLSNSFSTLNSVDLNGFQAVLEVLRLIWQFLMLPINLIVYLFKVIAVLSPIQFI